MTDRIDCISRAQLIAGLFATGALAACGGIPSGSATIGKRCVTPLASLRSMLDEIFAHPIFKDVDKNALIGRFDASSKVAPLQHGYFAQAAQQVQNGSVIEAIPPQGIVIRSPGTYTFGGDIQWTPNNVTTSAITIASDDVTLDLGGFTLTASISDKSQHISGILVTGPVSNVTIINGTVANAPEYGILATGVCTLKIARITVTGVCMYNTTTKYLTPAGIHVSNSDDVAIANCSVTQFEVTASSSAGIQLFVTTRAAVSDCRIQGMLNHDGAVQGFSYVGCSNVTTTRCVAQTLQSLYQAITPTEGHTVLGFCPIFCLDLSYIDCSASNLTGCCDDCHGMSVFLDARVTVTRFQANQIVDGPEPYKTGAKATGLEVYGAEVNVVDSVASNIVANDPQDKQATGFSAWGVDIKFTRCYASSVVVLNPASNSHADGFGWAPDPRTEPIPFSKFGALLVTYTDCSADSCQVGFDTWFHVNSTWIRPKFTNCATGILIEPGATRTLTCDPCSECPTGLTTPLTNIESGNTFVYS